MALRKWISGQCTCQGQKSISKQFTPDLASAMPAEFHDFKPALEDTAFEE
jgi:hypothetical protein